MFYNSTVKRVYHIFLKKDTQIDGGVIQTGDGGCVYYQLSLRCTGGKSSCQSFLFKQWHGVFETGYNTSALLMMSMWATLQIFFFFAVLTEWYTRY